MSFTTPRRSPRVSLITGALTLFLSFAGWVQAQSAPVAGKFVFQFQSSEDPTYQAFVLPLDFQTGVQAIPSSTIPWPGATSAYLGSSYMLGISANNTASYTEVKSPVAYFGSGVGASVMYEETSYRFALHAGDAVSNTSSGLTSEIPSGVYLKVYAKSEMSAGTVRPAQTLYLPLPYPGVSVISTTSAGSAIITVPSTSAMGRNESVSGTGIPVGAMIVSIDSDTQVTISAPVTVGISDTTLTFGGSGEWTAFGDNGYQATLTVRVANGSSNINILDTVVQVAMTGASSSQWNDGNIKSGPLLITHKAHAGAEQYYFVVSSTGGVQGADQLYPMSSIDDQGTQPGDTMGYAMNFDPISPWSSKLLTTPSFQGTPMPSAYYGKSTTEIEAQSAPVELNLGTPDGSQFIGLSKTPELQSHKVLNDFVLKMGGDPMALAAYVQNHIGLTDALAYNNQGNLSEASVNAGGMERSAIGTLLEGQGSPEEQCALLVYLLRQAGFQAAYVVPKHNSLQLADQRLSNLLRMRIAGAMSPDGTSHVPKFIYCNYPFVAAYVPTNGSTGDLAWVPLFPWLKDTEVKQGLNVNNYLPNGASDIRQWVRNFLLAKPGSTMWDSDTSPLTSMNTTYRNLFDDSGNLTTMVVAVANPTGIIPGMSVKGDGIQPGTLVAAIRPATVQYSCTTVAGSSQITIEGNTEWLVPGCPVPEPYPQLTGIVLDPDSLPLWMRPQPSHQPLFPSNVFVVIESISRDIATGITTLTVSANANFTGVTMLSFPSSWNSVSGSLIKLTKAPAPPSSPLFTNHSVTFQTWDRTPGGFFLKALGDNLKNKYPGISVADLGVSFLDRKYNYTSWVQFPQPIPVSPTVTINGANVSGSIVTVSSLAGLEAGMSVSGAGIQVGTTIQTISSESPSFTLSMASTDDGSNVTLAFTNYPVSETLMGGAIAPSQADSPLYDTMDITITSTHTGISKKISGLRIMDMHNRRASINFVPTSNPSPGIVNSYNLIFTLAPYDLVNPSTGLPGSTPPPFTYGDSDSNDPFMRQAQQIIMPVTSAEQNYTFTVVYHRNRRYPGKSYSDYSELGGWPDFLGIVMSDFLPDSTPLSATITAGSSIVSISNGTTGMQVGQLVTGDADCIPPNTTIASIIDANTITLSATASANGSMLHYSGGSGSTVPVVSSFSLGDLNAFCMNTGRVTSAMVNVHMQSYNQLQQQTQQQIATAPNTQLTGDTLDTMQSTLAYLMGMSYYQRMSDSMDYLKNLFQVNSVSTRAHGFGQFGAEKWKSTTGTIATDGPNGTGNLLPMPVAPANSEQFTARLQQTYPKVDMRYAFEVNVGYGDLRADAGGQGTLQSSDFYFNLMILQGSSLESQTIAQYFDGQNTDAISTFSLLQRVNMGLSSSTTTDAIIELDSGNYLQLGDQKYTANGIEQSLSSWAGGGAAGSIWSSILAAFAGWDADQVRVYICPGDATGANGQWRGMVALILGRDQGAALIGANNVINGATGASMIIIGYNRIDGTISVSSQGNPLLFNNTVRFQSSVSINGNAGIDYPTLSNPASGGFISDLSSMSIVEYENLAKTSATNFNYSPSTNYLSAVAGATISTAAGAIELSNFARGSLNGAPYGGVTAALAQINSTTTLVYSASGVSLMTGDPVNTMTGELYADEIDLVLPGPLPLQIRRNYSSRMLSSGEFGFGWKPGMFPFLVTYLSGTDTKIQAAEMDGTVITYTPDPASQNTWIVSAEDNPLLSNGSGMNIGSVHNPFHNTLSVNIGGGPTTENSTYTLTGADGCVRIYTVRSFPVATDSTVKRQRPYLTSWTDSSGNSLNFYYYGDGGGAWYSVNNTDPAYGQLAYVKASNGNFVSFTYDAYGHISNIITADGRQLTYSYDANGDLRQVDFPDGSWTKYDYLIQIGTVGSSTAPIPYSTHLISQETRPGGRQVQTFYVKFQTGDLDENGTTVDASRVGNDVSTARRVDYQMASVGQGSYNVTKPVTNSAGLAKNAQYSYHLTTDPAGNITGRTEITDAYNRKTIYYYLNSRLVLIMDPLSTVNDPATGAGLNPKLVQTWYTTTDANGAWAGGLSSIYQRGGSLTTFQYNTSGDVTQISVNGYLDGQCGPSYTEPTADITPIASIPQISVSAGTGSGPVINNFVSANTATTTMSYTDDGRHLLSSVIHPHPLTSGAAGRCTVYRYTDVHHPYFATQVDEYEDSQNQANPLNSTKTTYQNVPATQPADAPYANGLPLDVTLANGMSDSATTHWTYNYNGFPTQKQSYSGQAGYPDEVVQYVYDLRGQLYQEQVMNGGTAAKTNLYAYDEMGRPIWVERREGGANGKQVGWNYTYYNLNGDVEWTDGSRSNPEDYTYARYDGAGRPVEKTTWRSRAKADGSGVEAVPGADLYATTNYSYNMFGDLLGITDPVGNSVKASYDAIGRKTGTIAYQGNWQTGSTEVLATTTTSYDDVALGVTTTDPRGGVTSEYRTSSGKPALRINPDGTRLSWLYYLDGRIHRQPISATTYVEFTYDDVHRTVTKTTRNTTDTSQTPETFTETVTADHRGNIISATDVAGFTTSTNYDGLNRPMTVSIPVATITEEGVTRTTSAARTLTHTYDAAGFKHTVTDAANEVSETDYDTLGRVTTTSVKVSGTTTVVSQSSVSYSSDFQSVTTTSGTGAGAVSETAWTDLAGHTVLVKHADGSTASFSYDAAGNAIASTSETGQTTTSTYDGLQRLLTSTLPDGATTQFVYAYPAGGGQTTERRMPGSLTEFTKVDAVGRPVESYLKGTGGALTRHYTSYAYYTSGKEQGLLQSYTDPNGYSHSVTYDAWLRPATTSAGTAGTAAYVYRQFLGYDPRGMALQVRETTSTGVSQIDRSYDGQGHLYDEKVSLGSSAGSLAVVTDLTSSYDNVGRRASLGRGSAVASVGASGGSWGFQYRADGLLSEVDVAGGAFTYTYGNNGLLQSRSNPFRNFSVSGRDSRGRIVSTSTSLVNGGATVVSENISSWSFDNKQLGYSCWHQSSDLPGTPAAWTDSRSYTYSTQRRQLAAETWTNSPDKTVLNASITGTQTLNYTFDGGAAGGLGVRTRAQTTTAGTTQQHLISAQDAWARATGETGGFEKRFPFTVSGAAPGAASVELRVGPSTVLNQVSFPAVTAMTTGAWSRDLSLPAGSYALNAIATHPSGMFTTQTSSSFTLAVSAFGVAETYDAVGNVTTRTVTDGTYTRTQTLTWDAEGRLMSVAQTDNSSLGQAFTWTATYDARSRRIQAQTQFTSGGPQAGRTLTETSWYDPLVEFLEVGLEVSWGATGGSVTSHERWWKVHGPDLNGGYGGLQGMGGLEAMVNEVNGEVAGFIDDNYGHMLGFAHAPGVTSGSAPTNAFVGITATFEWNVGRFGGYGPLPGYWSPAIADGVATWRTFGWRGKRMEVTGYYHLGARDYEASSGRFLSADPFGHVASMSLYDYAGGDPINFVDPRGRSPEQGDESGVISNIKFASSGLLRSLSSSGSFWNHTASSSNVAGILSQGMQSGRDGLRWFSDPESAGQGAPQGANTNIKFKMNLEGLDLVELTEQDFAKLKAQARAATNANSLAPNGSPEWKAEWGGRYNALRSAALAAMPGDGALISAPNGATYLVLKEKGWAAAGASAVGVSGEGATEAMAALYSQGKYWEVPGRGQAVLGAAGRVLLPVAIGISAYELYTAENLPREVVKQAGGWTGAWIGAKVGAAGGAEIGAWAGTLIEPGGGTVVGGAVVGFIGAIGGGITGAWLGQKVTTTIYDEWTLTPGVSLGPPLLIHP